MNARYAGPVRSAALAAAILSLGCGPAAAMIDGVIGSSFTFTAKEGSISAGDGQSIYCWGYANGNGLMQYPGPTMIVSQGSAVTVALANELPEPVSIVFPGQGPVTARGGRPGLLAREAPPGGRCEYTFTAHRPGTYIYHSGTRPELQVEMGLVGALIVRPAGFDTAKPRAYEHPGSAYEDEFLYLLTEMDPVIHEHALKGTLDRIDTTAYWPVYWFINGRNAPDTMLGAGVPWLPHQPYNCMPMGHPGDRMLFRFIGGGRDLHPLHTHGNHTLLIARDGRMLESVPGVSGPDLAVQMFTVTVAPGATYDAVFRWTGAKLGWDIYGHAPGDPMEPGEYAPDHGKPFPVVLPDAKDLAFGPQYSGSQFLGGQGLLPPGEGGFNPTAGFFYMSHSHNEKEMTNNDIFPGGMMTMVLIDRPGAMGPMMQAAEKGGN
ncbi:MAG: multicopper oxidase domain-containing protein [bacterium]|nr:multicopper oxidase domain-containing protein [bacterium]